MSLLRFCALALTASALFGAPGCGDSSSAPPADSQQSQTAAKASMDLDKQWQEKKDAPKK